MRAGTWNSSRWSPTRYGVLGSGARLGQIGYPPHDRRPPAPLARRGQRRRAEVSDVVLAIGFEKLRRRHHRRHHEHGRPVVGPEPPDRCAHGLTARRSIWEERQVRRNEVPDHHGRERHAQKGHRRFGLDRASIKMADNSPPLVGELRMIHMCSQSDGACAVVSRRKKKQAVQRQRGVGGGPRDSPSRRDHDLYRGKSSHRVAAERLFARSIAVCHDIDVFEMYDPSHGGVYRMAGGLFVRW